MNKQQVYDILDSVTDPEIPVLTIRDLGIIRDVELLDGNGVKVVITPTYSGCPAMNVIEFSIKAALTEAGFDPVEVNTILSPAWTTDWMSEEGKQKLKEYGIAPPAGKARIYAMLEEDRPKSCPRCNTENVKILSHFGSTPCKALYQCNECLETFDYFKCH
jgi:ring-1,2-phenylacetyl-CoA epoxidase subunit PaaD